MAGVGNILGNLKNMATDMGAEIEKQNKQLDLIQGKVIYFVIYYMSSMMMIQTAGADVRIEQANKRTEKLLK